MESVSDGYMVPYQCVLDPGCRGTSHTGHCIDLNARYVAALREQERRRRIETMEAVIASEADRLPETNGVVFHP